MNYIIHKIVLLVIGSCFCIGVIQAQDSTSRNDQDRSSEQAEAREDAYRKSMELDGSRDRDTYSNTVYSTQAKQEKIDKLPKESRDNIRNQLTDIIIENGQWEPFDAFREYPYEPSETAQEAPALREREKEAWAEQVEKYHQREARAFETSKHSMWGSDAQQAGTSPGPSGQQGQSQGEAKGEGEPQGESQNGEGTSLAEGGQQDSRGSSTFSSAGSYEPYQTQQNNATDEISTAGVSESALDFLRAGQGQGSSSPSQGPQQQPVSEFIIPGTIAIEDLDKLEGLAEPEDDSENL